MRNPYEETPDPADTAFEDEWNARVRELNRVTDIDWKELSRHVFRLGWGAGTRHHILQMKQEISESTR